jgi:hypothetical protein
VGDFAGQGERNDLACKRFVNLALEVVARPSYRQLIPVLLARHSITQQLQRRNKSRKWLLGKLRSRLSTARSERRRGCSLTGAITGASWILSSDHAAAQGHYRTKPHKSSPRWDSKAHPVTQSNAASIDVTTHWDVASVQSPNPIQLIAEPSSGHQWKSRRESSRRQTKGSAFARREARAFSFC